MNEDLKEELEMSRNEFNDLSETNNILNKMMEL